jgi:hypothetical protein
MSHSLACHLLGLVVLRFANNRFKCGIIGKYHTTLRGGYVLRLSFVDVAEFGHLYCKAEHIGQASKSLSLLRYTMQSLVQALIFLLLRKDCET